MIRNAAIVLCLVLVTWTLPAGAYWITDGATTALVSTAQDQPAAAGDGAGGIIVAWRDSGDIHAQRMDASGAAAWGPVGMGVCTDASAQSLPATVGDGDGGAVIAWLDARNGNTTVYAQRMDATGQARWLVNGVRLSTSAGTCSELSLATDGAGGAIATWSEYRSGVGYLIVAQRVTAAGGVVWAADGITVAGSLTSTRLAARAVADGSGGAVIAWSDSRAGNFDIYAQHLNYGGNAVWTAEGLAVCAATGSQSNVGLAATTDGGAIITWTDTRSGNADVYAQRMTGAGAVSWTANGIQVHSYSTASQSAQSIVADGSGGAILAWTDARTGNNDIYAQRLSSAGARLWAGDRAVCSNASVQVNPMVVGDGSGSATVAWIDYRSTSADIQAQRLDATGSPQWVADGVAVCAAFADQTQLVAVSDGAAGAVMAWSDTRLITSGIRAQSIDAEGTPGRLAPRIRAAADVPGDQGGRLELAWSAARSDAVSDGNATYYSVWRAIDAVKTVTLESLAEFDVAATGPVVRAEKTATGTYYWELVGTTPAAGQPGYASAVPTLFDSTAVHHAWTYVQVVAHTAEAAVFWASEPDSGYSVDNLAPSLPANLVARYEPDQVALDWDDAPEADVISYLVYRGLTADFDPSAADLAAEVGVSHWTDPTPAPWGWHYKVLAMDDAGNLSPAASPALMSDAGSTQPPFALRLHEATPNPFNPSTRLSFEIAVAGPVRLRVIDSRGLVVVTLLEATIPAGRRDFTWDGRDDTGRSVPSGVYFAQLSAAGQMACRKMTLLK